MDGEVGGGGRGAAKYVNEGVGLLGWLWLRTWERGVCFEIEAKSSTSRGPDGGGGFDEGWAGGQIATLFWLGKEESWRGGLVGRRGKIAKKKYFF